MTTYGLLDNLLIFNAAPVLGADDLEAWVEGWLQTPDGPVEHESGELIEPDAGQRLFLPLFTN